FAFNAIQMLSLDSFKTGMILLSGLFFYDIFWVFGTEVMITVAKSFDAPIKVVWPKQLLGLQPNEALQFTMLGLGDIVIPGIYVALCLRFDHNLHLKRNPTAKKYSKFSTPYFNSCFTSYILGLITTIVVMHTFKAAQPALLYLSPACIISVLMESNLLIAYAALGTMAVVPIYYGSFASVKWPKKKKTECAKFDHEAESSDEEDSSTESLSTEDAYLFPIIGSVVLFSLYLVFKLLNKDYVNYLVTGYFAFLGVIAVTNVGVYIVKNVIGLKVDSYKIRLTKKAE
ncbi:1884_t:CDS:2, partial [Entrophospora sp. SA101]